jgi:hypothetical protein
LWKYRKSDGTEVTLNQQANIHVFYGKGHENHELCTGFFIRKRNVLAVKKVQFVSVRMSYIILRGRWCEIIALNIHPSTEYKIDGMKGSFYEELEHVFDKFPEYHMTILLGDFSAKVGREDILKPKLGTRVYKNLIMIMELHVE